MLHRSVITKVKKLKFESGASLSMALLLFLVCAVVGAVVLTAGTAAAGRLSRLSEMDQRYYSVTSAAELIAGKLTGETVTVVRTRQYSEEITKEYEVTLDAEGAESVTLSSTDTERTAVYTTAVNGSPYSTDVTVTTDGSSYPASGVGSDVILPNTSFLTARALKLMFGDAACNTDAAMDYSFASGHSESAVPFTIEHTSSQVSVDGLGVKGSCKMKSDGTLVIRLSDNAAKDNYVLVVTLRPSFSENVKTTSGGSDSPTVTPSASGYTELVRKIETVTKTSSVTWTVGSITKEVSGPDETP